MTDHWVNLELDLNTFDTAKFAPYVERCRNSGIRMTTMEILGDAEKITARSMN
jgi:hypothetical protein